MTLTKPDLTTSLTGKWKSYPAYKDSGVEWLGEIPVHWGVRRLQFDCKINPKGDSLNLPGEMEVSFLPMECIGEDGRLSLEKTRTIEQVRQGYTYFQNEDVILAKITPCFENGKGALCQGLLNGIGFGTTELHILRANEETYPKFIFYLTKSDPFQKIGAAMMYGAAGQKRLPEEFIRDFPVSTPTLLEQQAIATFLDREIAKINTLIVKKERLIELLQEKRAAIISQAVTKGLDPTVAMKNSGVEWLGEIPEHWETKRVRDVTELLQTGPFGSQLHSSDYTLNGIPVINPSHLRNGRIYPDWDCAVNEETRSRLVRHELQEGDIIFARRGEMGRCALVTKIEKGWLCGTGSLLIRPRTSMVSPLYLNMVLSTSGVKDWLLLESVGSTMNNLNTSILSRIPVPTPPLTEQNAITEYIDREMSKIDALISRIREGIEKLKEYSTALISAAVTGKIDVRGEIALLDDMDL